MAHNGWTRDNGAQVAKPRHDHTKYHVNLSVKFELESKTNVGQP
jgi:hypothetical protein